MTQDPSPLDLATFSRRLEEMGIAVPEERVGALHDAYRDLMALTARLRPGFGHADEPAHVFPPEGDR